MSIYYPACDFCGSCEHCPTHDFLECMHPMKACPECGSDRVYAGEKWDGDSHPDYVMYCMCCEYEEYI